jgi:hypothetical protein
MKQKSSRPIDDNVIVEKVVLVQEEVVKLELIKDHLGLENDTEAIKALIAEKWDAIKLAKEKRRNQQIEEDRAMEYLKKGEYICPM